MPSYVCNMHAVCMQYVCLAINYTGSRQRCVQRELNSVEETRTRGLLREKARRGRETERVLDRERELSRVKTNSGHICSQQHSVSLLEDAALVPTASMSVEVTKRERKTLSAKSRFLLPQVKPEVAPVREKEIRIEVRTSALNQNDDRLTPHNQLSSAGAESVLLPTLPLPSSDSAAQERSGKREMAVGHKTELSHQMSIISVGAMGQVRQPKPWRRGQSPEQRKRRRKREGRLSHGWAKTQPLGAVTGCSVYSDKERGTLLHRGRGLGGREGKIGQGGEGEMSRDCIHIDVQEYLANV